MKYKLLKQYPCITHLEIGDMVELNKQLNVYLSVKNFNGIKEEVWIKEVENWPEYWQKVKEPLFTTFDGVEYYEMEGIVYEVYTSNNCPRTITLNKYPSPKDYISDDEYKYFSSKIAAEKWIDENRPVFSKRQIEEALDNNIASLYDRDECKKELGI